MHSIHAGHVGQTPWGWRDGLIGGVDADGWITVDYLLVDGSARLWHHEDLQASAGTPVRVHEQWKALSGPFGPVNVVLGLGIGAVTTLEHPEA